MATGTGPGLSHPRALVSRLLQVFKKHLAQVTGLPTVARVFPKISKVLDVRTEHPVPLADTKGTAQNDVQT